VVATATVEADIAPLSVSVSAAPREDRITVNISANRCVDYRVSARARPADPITVTSGDAPCSRSHVVVLGDEPDEVIDPTLAYTINVVVTDPETGETDTSTTVLPPFDAQG
jgi:hypothetical protein